MATAHSNVYRIPFLRSGEVGVLPNKISRATEANMEGQSSQQTERSEAKGGLFQVMCFEKKGERVM